MKKILMTITALGFMAAMGFSQPFSLKIGGGLGFISGGDLALGIRGQSDLLIEQYGAVNKFNFPRKGVSFSGEFIYYPWPHFGIGIGGGYLQHVQESTVSHSIGLLGSMNTTETIKPQISAIPITLNLHWLIFLSSRLHLDVSAGAGYYSTTLKWNYTNVYSVANLSGSEQYTFEAKKGGIGYQAGLGLEFSVSSRIAVVLNVSGRSASIGPFTGGTWTGQGRGDFAVFNTSGSDHSFWFYDWQVGNRLYPLIAFQADQPGGYNSVNNARTANVDLTGVTATIGLRLGFGR